MALLKFFSLSLSLSRSLSGHHQIKFYDLLINLFHLGSLVVDGRLLILPVVPLSPIPSKVRLG